MTAYVAQIKNKCNIESYCILKMQTTRDEWNSPFCKHPPSWRLAIMLFASFDEKQSSNNGIKKPMPSSHIVQQPV